MADGPTAEPASGFRRWVGRVEAGTPLVAKALVVLAVAFVIDLLGAALLPARLAWVVVTAVNAGMLLGGLALVANRARRLSAVARSLALGAPDVRPPPPAGTRDELLQVEREVHHLSREITVAARQQTAVADVARRGHVGAAADDLLDFAVARIARDLGVEDVAIVEWVAARQRLLVRAWTTPAAADRAVDRLLATEGMVEGLLGAVGAVELRPDGSGGTVTAAPVVAPDLHGLVVVFHDQAAAVRPEDSTYLGAFSESLMLALAHSSDRERLAESDERFRTLIEQVPGVIYTRTAAEPSVVTYVSPQVEAILGRPASDWMEDPGLWLECMHPEDRERVRLSFSESITGGSPFDCRYRMVDASGRLRWLHDTGVVRRGHDGVKLMQGVAVDITDSERLRGELAEQQARLEAVLAASPVIMVQVGADGRNQFVSRSVYPVAGRRVEDLVGQPAARYAHPDDAPDLVAGFVDMVEGRSQRYRGIYRYAHADGNWLTMECRGEVLRDEAGEFSGAVYALVDVTDTVHLSEDLRAAKEAAERANLAKNEFLSRMSHELRTPMNAVLGFAQLLELEDLGTDGSDSVDQILRAGKHLLGLINEVLEISRIEAGSLALSLEPVEVGEILDEVLELLAPVAERRSVVLVADESSEQAFVRADKQRLKQVLLNVVGNGIKYNDEGGTVRVICRPTEDDAWRIDVEDDGPGIEADKLERVFVPFDRLGAESTGVEGTGLGLALSQRLVEAMDGELSVSSRIGVGSAFAIVLPKADRSAWALAASSSDGLAPVGRRLSGRILYVEDNLSNLRLVERLLARHPDVELLSAMQGLVGLQLARDHPVDLVLLDLNLPDIDGDVVLARLRANPTTADVPVVVVSADATPRQVDRLLGLGAQAYLTKPIDVSQFYEVVGDRLRARAAAEVPE